MSTNALKKRQINNKKMKWLELRDQVDLKLDADEYECAS